MPRKKATPPPIGHNGEDATREAKDLRIVHVSRLRAQQIKVEAAKAVLDAERQVFTDLAHRAKADTHIDRQQFTSLLEDLKKPLHELLDFERIRAQLRADWDLPAGFQPDLFAERPKDDEAAAKGLGYSAGLRGEACMMPEGMHPSFAASFADGWGKGQEELGFSLSRVGHIVDRKPGAGQDIMPAKPQGDSSDDGDEGGEAGADDHLLQ